MTPRSPCLSQGRFASVSTIPCVQWMISRHWKACCSHGYLTKWPHATQLLKLHLACCRVQAAVLGVHTAAASAVMALRRQRMALELMAAVVACISAARKPERRTSMTPFRMSWPGDQDNDMPQPALSASKAEALEALREFCQAASGAEPYMQRGKAAVGSLRTDSSKLHTPLSAAAGAACSASDAAVTLRLVRESAEQLGLEASVRAAADAAALQLRVWDGQDAALLAQAWSWLPARSRTVSGAGTAEPLIRISAGGELDSNGEHVQASSHKASDHARTELPGSGRTAPQDWRCKTSRAAVTLVWRPRVRIGDAAGAICWPQCSAGASEHSRSQWQQQQQTVVSTEAASVLDQRLAADSDPDPAEVYWPADRQPPDSDDSNKPLDIDESTLRPKR